MGDADGFVYGPTPLEAADHIEAGGALMWQDAWDGVWAASNMSADRWRARTNPDAPRHAYRLVPLPVVPPVPVVVKVEDANDAQALIGRSIGGRVIGRWVGRSDIFELLFEDSPVTLSRSWGFVGDG